MMKEFGKRHERFYRIKETVHKLNDQDLNAISDIRLSRYTNVNCNT